MIMTNIFALDFDMIPENFHATNVKVSFGLASSVDGAKNTVVIFTNDEKDSPENIMAYYKQYFDKEWDICKDEVDDLNKFVLDHSGNKYKVEQAYMGFNKSRLLGTMFKVGKDIETNKTNTFIVQYYYSNQQQFYRDYKAACK